MKFSIIIPTFNRPASLTRTLDSIAQITYPQDGFEVIVVDDGSRSPVAGQIESGSYPFRLQIIRQPNSGPGRARNRGANEATGDFLAFTDDDCTLNPQWLHAFAAALERHPNALLGGTTINAVNDNIYAVSNTLLSEAVTTSMARANSPLSYLPSNNLACSRAAFFSIGGFNQSLHLAAAEDREFSMRWADTVGPLQPCPEAIIQHHHAQTLFSFTRMHFRYGRGAANLHAVRNSNPIEHARFDLYRSIFTAPFQSRSLPAAIPLFALLFWSQFTATMGFFFERLKRR